MFNIPLLVYLCEVTHAREMHADTKLVLGECVGVQYPVVGCETWAVFHGSRYLCSCNIMIKLVYNTFTHHLHYIKTLTSKWLVLIHTAINPHARSSHADKWGNNSLL